MRRVQRSYAFQRELVCMASIPSWRCEWATQKSRAVAAGSVMTIQDGAIYESVTLSLAELCASRRAVHAMLTPYHPQRRRKALPTPPVPPCEAAQPVMKSEVAKSFVNMSAS